MVDTTVYATLATHIVKNQLSVMGPLAIDQAKMVPGITIEGTDIIRINGNGKDVLERLVKQFEHLFGQASVEACKEAMKESQVSIASKDLPDSLK